MTSQRPVLQFTWIAIFVAVLGWSAVEPHDYPTWWLEVLPALLALAVLAATRSFFPLTPLLYWLVLLLSRRLPPPLLRLRL